MGASIAASQRASAAVFPAAVLLGTNDLHDGHHCFGNLVSRRVFPGNGNSATVVRFNSHRAGIHLGPVCMGENKNPLTNAFLDTLDKAAPLKLFGN